MKTMKLSKLKNAYADACNEYVTKFQNKHKVEHLSWIEEFRVACFSGFYHISMDDIIYDINNKCPEGLIFQWQDDYFKYSAREHKKINFQSYAAGLRYAHLNEEK
jgi:hypothetical protein